MNNNRGLKVLRRQYEHNRLSGEEGLYYQAGPTLDVFLGCSTTPCKICMSHCRSI
jgi:hypothetical protein